MIQKKSLNRRVIIIKSVIKQYRTSFFEQLYFSLLTEGVKLEVLYSRPNMRELSKEDNVNLPPIFSKVILGKPFLGGRLFLQLPNWCHLFKSDLIIIVNANSNVLNFPLLILSRIGLINVALWGHAKNHQGSAVSLREKLKKIYVLWPNWWFSYTENTTRYLVNSGFKHQCITTINNAIDTKYFSECVQGVTDAEINSMRKYLQLTSDDRVALFCGSLYPEKRILEMLEISSMVAKVNSNFRLIVVGSGPQKNIIEGALKSHEYLRYVGPIFGRDKAIFYRLAEFILNPGLVGLAILDAFAAGCPVLTLEDSLHSPEIDYLVHEENGLLVRGGVTVLAHEVVNLLNDDSRLEYLREGAQKTSLKFSIDKMVSSVHDGIMKCLAK